MVLYSRYENIKIQELQNQLQSKDDQIFELEATAATATAESTHRAKIAEMEAQKRIHQVEEELRRVKIEADQYKGSWLRQKKRVVELESGVKNGNDAGSKLDGNEADVKVRRAFDKFGDAVVHVDQDDTNEIERDENNTTNKANKLSGAKRRMSHEPDTNHNDTADATKLSHSHHPLNQVAYLNASHSKMECYGTSLARNLLMRDEMGFYSPDEDTLYSSLMALESSSFGESDASDENQTKDSGVSKCKQQSSGRNKSSPHKPDTESETTLSPNPQSKFNYQRLQREVLKLRETRSTVSSLLHHMDAALLERQKFNKYMPTPLSDSGLVINLLMNFDALFQKVVLDEDDAVRAAGDTSKEERQDIQSLSQPLLQPSTGYEVFLVILSSSQYYEKNKVRTSHSAFAPLSWQAALYILQLLNDIMDLSTKCRSDLRLWFYRSRHCSTGSDIGSCAVNNSREPLSSRSSDSKESHPRIEGLPARSEGRPDEALKLENFQRRFDKDAAVEWDPVTMPQSCNNFFELLVALMKGNVFGREEITRHIELELLELEKNIIQEVRLKAIDLVFRLMSDAVPSHNSEFGQNNSTPYLWKFWFDSLLPLYVQPHSTGSDTVTEGVSGSDGNSSHLSNLDDFFSPWDRRTRSSYKSTLLHYLKHEKSIPSIEVLPPKYRTRGHYSSGTSTIDTEGGSAVATRWKSKQDIASISTKRCILKLLCLLLSSSSSVQKSTFEVASLATRSATRYKSLAHRMVVAIQIEINDNILPILSAVPKNAFEAQKLYYYLQLCHACVNFFFVLCQSNEGIHMIRLQIRLSQEDDTPSWSSSSISSMLSILNSALTLGTELEDTTPNDIIIDMGEVLNRIVEMSIVCFKMILRFVHHQQLYQQTKKFGNTSLLALISGQRHMFLSSCNKILSTGAKNLFQFSDDLKCDTRLLLEEILMDEEDERGYGM